MEVVALSRQQSINRRRSFSQLSVNSQRKELSNIDQSGDEEDGWCNVDYAKPGNNNKSLWEDTQGYQTERLQLELTNLVIRRMEELAWEQITKDIDFTNDPGAIPLNFNFPAVTYDDYEIGLQAEEGILSASVSIDESLPCSDMPCSSRSFPRRAPLDPDTDAEGFKTDCEDNYDSSNEKNYEKILKQVEEKAKSINEVEELLSMVTFNHESQNLIPSRLPPPGDQVFIIDNRRLRVRGTWAPPKRKFIFDLSEPRDVQTCLTLQNERCAGCGMKFTKIYARRAKICSYYNKLFCQCCFSNEKIRIPARILHQWNFKEYSVSEFAYKFLTEYSDHPIYNVRAVNPDLYKKVKSLKKIRILRIKASHMWQYIQLCRIAETTITSNGILTTTFTSIPRRFLSLEEVDVYSILDFEAVESGNLQEMLEPIVNVGKIHIEGCQECMQRSFFCSICFNQNDPLFSFQLEKVYRCDECGSLAHLKCFNRERRKDDWSCGKCDRIRRKHIRQSTPSLCIECNSE
jgi:hypothetical protein